MQAILYGLGIRLYPESYRGKPTMKISTQQKATPPPNTNNFININISENFLADSTINSNKEHISIV